MISHLVKKLAQYLGILLVLIVVFFLHPIASFGFMRGMLLGCLAWSAYILMLPAAHGYYMIGSFARFIGNRAWHTEPMMVSLAVLYNLFIWIFFNHCYRLTFITSFLYRVITNPKPYWVMILVSLLGTCYPALVGHSLYDRHYQYHRNIRLGLIVVGYISFMYFSFWDLVVLVNHWT